MNEIEIEYDRTSGFLGFGVWHIAAMPNAKLEFMQKHQLMLLFGKFLIDVSWRSSESSSAESDPFN